MDGRGYVIGVGWDTGEGEVDGMNEGYDLESIRGDFGSMCIWDRYNGNRGEVCYRLWNECEGDRFRREWVVADFDLDFDVRSRSCLTDYNEVSRYLINEWE
jgi:hypothetical protein